MKDREIKTFFELFTHHLHNFEIKNKKFIIVENY